MNIYDEVIRVSKIWGIGFCRELYVCFNMELLVLTKGDIPP